jgi:hypothetical protein
VGGFRTRLHQLVRRRALERHNKGTG